MLKKENNKPSQVNKPPQPPQVNKPHPQPPQPPQGINHQPRGCRPKRLYIQDINFTTVSKQNLLIMNLSPRLRYILI